MRRVRRHPRKSQPSVSVIEPSEPSLDDRSVSVAMIQALIPLGLRAVQDALEQEVTELAGTRYARQDGRPDVVRWGSSAARSFSRIRSCRCECRACAIAAPAVRYR